MDERKNEIKKIVHSQGSKVSSYTHRKIIKQKRTQSFNVRLSLELSSACVLSEHFRGGRHFPGPGRHYTPAESGGGGRGCGSHHVETIGDLHDYYFLLGFKLMNF